jgi:glycosyltransferase involved in cell wall biosynthesis
MISVVYCTKEHKPEHIEHLKKACGNPKVEIIEYVNKGEGLTKFYDKAIKEAKNDIIVFCHDDITIETKQIAKKITKLFDKNPEYGILGVAGTKYMSETGRWWDDKKKMYGRVAHTHEGKTWLSKYSDDLGNDVEETVIVDGVFFSVHRGRIKEQFDLKVTGFHFYEVDFCFRNYLAGVKIGVHTNVRVNHQSIGATNQEWEDNRVAFADKFKDDLPVKIDRVFKGNERFKVLLGSPNIEESLELVTKLKKMNYNVTVVSPVLENDESNFKRLMLKGAKFAPINQPPGFKVGDGQWGLNGPNGPVASEPNKLYRVGEVDFDLLHVDNAEVANHLTKFYPELPSVTLTKDSTTEEIIDKYQTVLA